MRTLCTLIAVLWSVWTHAQSVSWDGADDQWRTSTSEHFQVHYLARHEAMAQRSLTIAEQVHDELLPFFKFAPQQRTEMVLVDDFDFSNGWATPLPFAQIRLFASPPQQISSLEHNDDWLQSLIRHEYVHVLHMELEGGVVASGRKVFGRAGLWLVPPLTLFPHAFTPSMMLEGLAVYLETNHEQGFGRLQSSYYSMQMREEVDSGQLDAMNSVILAQREWPTNRAYLYGAYFVEFLADRFGEERLQAFLHGYARQIMPYFLLDSYLRSYFGQPLESLWQQYQIWLQQRFGDELAELQQQQSTSELLTVASRRRQPTASDGEHLWYVESNGEDRPRVMQLIGQQAPQFIAWGDGIQALAVNDQGQLAATRLLSYADGRAWSDLFVLHEGDWQRVTKQQRLRALQWDAAHQRWLATRSVDGLSELVAVTSSGEVTSLWRGQHGEVLGELAVRSDGVIVAAHKPRAQGWNLARFVGHWQALTNSQAVENSPAFLPDGRVVFSADYDGVFDLWALTLDTEELPLQRLSQVASGAFAPQAWRGQLVWQQYGHSGFQLRVADIHELAAFSLQQWQGEYDYQWISGNDYPSRDYSPWPTLRPRYWLPYWSANDDQSYVGFSTSGQDALARHNYSARLSYDLQQQQTDWALSYGMDNRWLLSWQRSHRIDDVGFAELTRREDLLVLARQNLWASFEDKWRWHIGISHEYERWVRGEGPVTFDRAGLRESLLGIATTFDNRQSYLNVPGTGWGTYSLLVAESNDVLNSDYDGMRYQWEGRHTFDLPGRKTLTLAALAGYAEDQAQPFRLGGSDFAVEGALLGRDEFSLRGYGSSAAIGQNLYRTQVSYRHWLGRVERNWDTLPLGMGDWYGNLFVEQGGAWFDDNKRPDMAAAGAELTAELILGYRLLLPVSAGVAYGFDQQRDGDWELYWRLGLSF